MQLLQARNEAKRLTRSSSPHHDPGHREQPAEIFAIGRGCIAHPVWPEPTATWMPVRAFEQSFDDLKTHQLKTLCDAARGNAADGGYRPGRDRPEELRSPRSFIDKMRSRKSRLMGRFFEPDGRPVREGERRARSKPLCCILLNFTIARIELAMTISDRISAVLDAAYVIMDLECPGIARSFGLKVYFCVRITCSRTIDMSNI